MQSKNNKEDILGLGFSLFALKFPAIVASLVSKCVVALDGILIFTDTALLAA